MMRNFKRTRLKGLLFIFYVTIPILVFGYNGWEETIGPRAQGRYRPEELKRSHGRMRFGIYYGRPYWYRPHYFYYPYRPYYRQGHRYPYRSHYYYK